MATLNQPLAGTTVSFTLLVKPSLVAKSSDGSQNPIVFDNGSYEMTTTIQLAAGPKNVTLTAKAEKDVFNTVKVNEDGTRTIEGADDDDEPVTMPEQLVWVDEQKAHFKGAIVWKFETRNKR